MTSLFSARHSSKVSTSRRRLTSPNPANEDLFLNIANDADDAPDDTKSVLSSRSHRRKSIPTPAHAASSPAVDDTNDRTLRYLKSLSQPTPPRRANTDAALPNGGQSVLARASAIKHSAVNGDSPRDRILAQQRRQSVGPNTPNSVRTNTLRPSDFAYSTPEAFDPHAARDRLAVSSRASLHADGLESEVSTTAPSTVWDELNELKVRMRKLEHGGNIAKSRQNSNTAEQGERERPRTGTTQTTTSTRRSSHTEYLSPATTKITAPDYADLHPLLQSALAKARNNIGRGVYQALENTASDALQMAVLARSDASDVQSTAGSTVDGTAFSQKRILRKADSLCRDLTELCIALCESHSGGGGSPLEVKSAFRPGSRDKNGDMASVAADTNSPMTPFEERRRLADRVERLSSRYGQGRLAERRDFSQSTVLANRMNGRHASVTESSPGFPWAGAGVGRAATTSSHSRPATRDSSANEQSPERDATLRGPPRANTETQRPRPTHSARGSREYTSKHPLPGQNTSTLSVSTNRTIQAPSSGDRDREVLSPTSTETPLSPSRPRRRRAASNASSRAPPSTGAGLAERLEAKRQQQVASAQQLRGMDEAVQAAAPRAEGHSRRRSVGRGAESGE